MLHRYQAGDKAADFNYETPWEGPRTFYKSTEGKITVLIFLRYLGCPVCRMEMAVLKAGIGLLEAKQATVFVVLQSSPSTVAAQTGKAAWPFEIVCDPAGDLFRLYRVEPGGFFRYLHPSGLIDVMQATFRGYRHGRFEGRETQLPAVFVIGRDKHIQWAHYGKTIGDVPKPSAIADQIDASCR